MDQRSGDPSQFTYLVGKAAFDPTFAERLRTDPEEALRQAGIEPTDEVLDALDEVNLDSIERLAGALGDDRGIV